MYCLGLFVVVYSKQCCLQTNKYDQSLLGYGYLHSYKISLLYVCFVFKLWVLNLNLKKKEKMNKTAYHTYDARYHPHPYILSTTALSDTSFPCFLARNP